MRKKDKDVDDAQDFAGMPASTVVTPADIQSKEFSVSRFGGYRMRDVDEFLDHITESMTKLSDENERLRTATGLPAAPSIGAPDLADTSRQADEIIERARAEAATIVQDARAQAAAAAGGAVAGTDAGRAAVAPFLSQERDFLQQLAALVQSHAESVKGMAKASRAKPAAATAVACRADARRADAGADAERGAGTSVARGSRLRRDAAHAPGPTPGNDSLRGVRIVATGDGVADPGGRAGDGLGERGRLGRRCRIGRRRRPDAPGAVLGRGVTRGDRSTGPALVFGAAFALIVLAVIALGMSVVSDDGLRLPVVALVASGGGLLLLWLGVVRRSGAPPSAG